MKLFPTLLCVALLGSATLVAAPAAHAQINVNVNPPNWGPAVPQGAQYYYIPETDGFYDVQARQYVVRRDGQWIRSSTLSGYNPANFHPVIIDYVGAQPWSRYDEYRSRYPRGGNPSNGGLPPGQAKKLYRRGDGDDRRDDDRRRDDRRDDRRGDIIIPGGRLPLPGGRTSEDRRDEDRRRYERRDNDDRRYERRDDDDRDDDHGKYKNKGKGKKDKD